MADFDHLDEPDDPNELRSAAVDALKSAARQTDPREFSRLTHYALALIERARIIRHGGNHAILEASKTEVLQKDDVVRPGMLYHKILKFIAALRRP